MQIMTTRVLAAALLALFCLLAPSDAGAQGNAAAGGEQLLVSLPAPDWQVGFTDRKPGLVMTEYVPKGQTVKDWTRMMTVQIFAGSPLGVNDFIAAVKAQGEAAKACDKLTVSPAGTKKTPHFEGALAVLACSRHKQHGMGELTLIQALRGKDALYVVQRAWRGPAFTDDNIPIEETEFKEWLAFMNKVNLCDGRDPQRPCPGAK
jgi:hypothetical protein